VEGIPECVAAIRLTPILARFALLLSVHRGGAGPRCNCGIARGAHGGQVLVVG